MLGIESHCDYAIPAAEPIWKNTSEDGISGINTIGNDRKFMKFPGRPAMNNWEEVGGPQIVNPLPEDYIESDELPKQWNWANVDGTNYLTLSRNQHIPQYCGACWYVKSTVKMVTFPNI